ncbi:hypothetical protein [Streptomyces luteireticuli]|uniref:hypothetical protein n=1 Tax=Streptomyces luteireticuli TaxID=173858 RepID=UPI003558E296
MPSRIGVERRTSAWSKAETEADERERTARMIRLDGLPATGLPADAEEYCAIGRTCVEKEHWHVAYESIAPGLAAYQWHAIEVYAATRLR